MTQIGTLSDIGAQVGDVVKYTLAGGISTITRIDGDRYFNDMNDRDGEWGPLSSGPHFQIVRSARSPIRTVTVQEVVPGIYGKISIHAARPDNGVYYIAMVDSPSHKESTIHAAMTIDDIDKAIATLTEIRDEMK